MAKKKNMEDVFNSIVKNALEFSLYSADEFEIQPKRSLIDFIVALELFIKARLLKEHWTLLLNNLSKGNYANFVSGNLMTVEFDDAIDRLDKVLQEPLTKQERECFKRLRSHRNKLIHFYNAEYSRKSEKAKLNALTEISEGWFRLYQLFEDGTEAIWRSHPISLSNTSWQVVIVPFKLDVSDKKGLHLGSATATLEGNEVDMIKSLANISRFQIYLDAPNTGDTAEHVFYIDEFRAVDFLPPSTSAYHLFGNFEDYANTDAFKAVWQGFGYPTRDYVLQQDASTAAGYKNAEWFYLPDETTTWGCAFRTRVGIITKLDISDLRDGGIQFLLKGDGTNNSFCLRLMDTEVNYWGSYWIPIQDTTWHWVSVPFVIDSLKGFRWLGNDPNGTYWTENVGTPEMLWQSLTRINEIRFDVRFDKNRSVIDGIPHYLRFDEIYAVSDLPDDPPEAVDNFETYTSTDDLLLSWNQFGVGSEGLEITNESAYGNQAMKISYNGNNGYTGIRKRNILPPHNFSDYKAGIQFWLKGDGSDNTVVFRLQNGNEMWESYDIPLKETKWVHWAISFAADTVEGFRYLGNDPDNPVWSTDIGTKSQLYGDLASIDQIRFYVRNPQAIDQTYSFIVDKIEGVDSYSPYVNTYNTGIEDKESSHHPYQFGLAQNYPNPFNPATTIEYSIANPGLVKIEIYNLLGQRIKSLVNTHQAIGNYKLSFDASELASGMYFYRLKVMNSNNTSSYTKVRRMLLLK